MKKWHVDCWFQIKRYESSRKLKKQVLFFYIDPNVDDHMTHFLPYCKKAKNSVCLLYKENIGEQSLGVGRELSRLDFSTFLDPILVSILVSSRNFWGLKVSNCLVLRFLEDWEVSNCLEALVLSLGLSRIFFLSHLNFSSRLVLSKSVSTHQRNLATCEIPTFHKF